MPKNKKISNTYVAPAPNGIVAGGSYALNKGAIDASVYANPQYQALDAMYNYPINNRLGVSAGFNNLSPQYPQGAIPMAGVNYKFANGGMLQTDNMNNMNNITPQMYQAFMQMQNSKRKQYGQGGFYDTLQDAALLSASEGLNAMTGGLAETITGKSFDEHLGMKYKTDAGKQFKKEIVDRRVKVSPMIGQAFATAYGGPAAGKAVKGLTDKSAEAFDSNEGQQKAMIDGTTPTQAVPQYKEPNVNYNMATQANSAAPISNNFMTSQEDQPFDTSGFGNDFGVGPVDMTPMDMGTTFAYGGMMPMANGGMLMYGGARDYMANGGLTEYEGGGTHEENPNGGIPIGAGASVEEGETSFDIGDASKYIFSDRLKEGNKTYADISKSIKNKFKDRDNDAASKRAMDQQLTALAEKQEMAKAEKVAKLNAEIEGLTGEPAQSMQTPQQMDPQMMAQMQQAQMQQAPQGQEQMMQQQMQGQAPIDPQMQGQMAQAAFGGRVQYPTGGKMLTQQPIVQNPDKTLVRKDVYGNTYDEPMYIDPSSDAYYALINIPDYDRGEKPLNIPFRDPKSSGGKVQYAHGGEHNDIDIESQRRRDNTQIGYGALGSSLADMRALYMGASGIEPAKVGKYTPTGVNLQRERNAAYKQSAMAGKIANANVRNMATSSSGALGNMNAFAAANSSKLSDVLQQSWQNQLFKNNEIDNQAKLTNIDLANRGKELDWQSKAAADAYIMQGLQGIGAKGQTAMTDMRQTTAQADYQRELLKALRTRNFNYNRGTGNYDYV